MGEIEYKVMLKQLEAQNKTNELLQETIALLKVTKTQQPTKGVVLNKPRKSTTRGANK